MTKTPWVPPPQLVEDVLRAFIDKVKARKELLDSIKETVESPPKKQLAPLLGTLGRAKGHLSGLLKAREVLQGKALSFGLDPTALKGLEDLRASIQRVSDFWPHKRREIRPEWISEEKFWRMLHGLEENPKKDEFVSYITEQGCRAMIELERLGFRTTAAARAREVFARLRGEKLVPARRLGKFSEQSFLKKLPKVKKLYNP